MNTYFKPIASFLLLIIGLFLALVPSGNSENYSHTGRNLRHLRISPYRLAEIVIEELPGFQIIDLRPAEEFAKFHFYQAINIPYDHLQDTDMLEQMDNEQTVILVAQSEDQEKSALQVLKRAGFYSVKILESGFANFISTFKHPAGPGNFQTNEDIARQEFAVSAAAYFFGSKTVHKTSSGTVSKPIPVKRRKKKKAADEGC